MLLVSRLGYMGKGSHTNAIVTNKVLLSLKSTIRSKTVFVRTGIRRGAHILRTLTVLGVAYFAGAFATSVLRPLVDKEGLEVGKQPCDFTLE